METENPFVPHAQQHDPAEGDYGARSMVFSYATPQQLKQAKLEALQVFASPIWPPHEAKCCSRGLLLTNRSTRWRSA